MVAAPTFAVVCASKMTSNATPVFASIFGWLILEVRAPLFFCKECEISQPRSSFAGNPHPAAAPLAGSAAVSGVVSNPKRTMGPGSVSGALSNAVAYPPPPRSASASVPAAITDASSRPSASASAAPTAAECATGNDASKKRARQEQNAIAHPLFPRGADEAKRKQFIDLYCFVKNTAGRSTSRNQFTIDEDRALLLAFLRFGPGKCGGLCLATNNCIIMIALCRAVRERPTPVLVYRRGPIALTTAGCIVGPVAGDSCVP